MTASAAPKPEVTPLATPGGDAPRLPGVFLILRESFHISWQLAGVLYGYAAWLLIPLLLSVLSTLLPADIGGVVDFVASLLFMIFGVWVSTVIIVYTALHYLKEENESINLDRLGHKAWERFLPVFTTQIFLTLAVIFGTFLLVVPGLIAMTVLAFAPIEASLSESTALAACRQSIELVRGKLLPTMSRLLIGNLVFTALLIAIVIILAEILSLSGADLGTLVSSTWLNVAVSLLEILVLPPLLAFHLILYFSLKKSYARAE